MSALKNQNAFGLTTGLQGDYLMNSCFTAAVGEKSQGSKSGSESRVVTFNFHLSVNLPFPY